MHTTLKLSFLSMALLGLVACGSSGGGSNSPANTAAENGSPAITPPTTNSIPSNPVASDELKAQIKKDKVFFNATTTIDIDDIPVTNQSLVILGKDFKQEGVELDLFPAFKVVTENWEEKFEVDRSAADAQPQKPDTYHEKGFWRVYNQVYSGTVAFTDTERVFNGNLQFDTPFRYFEAVAVGVPTAANDLPTTNLAHYTGKAFDYDQEGVLSYHVDFGKKEGYGEIIGLDRYGKITLEKSNISDFAYASEDTKDIFRGKVGQGITGKATAEKVYEYQTQTSPSPDLVTISRKVKAYDLQFFGPKAAEIGGVVRVEDEYQNEYIDRDDEAAIGFGGMKQ